MNSFLQDIRYALRQLRKNPGFTLVATLTLALGIGANTAIFTVLNAVLLKMLPVRDPQELVVVGDPSDANHRSNGTPQTVIFSYPLYKEFRDHNSVFFGLCAAATEHRIELTGEDGKSSSTVIGRMVSGNYFDVLGVQPAAGHLFSSSDDTSESANPEVVLGYGFWQSKFALSPSIIGKDIRLNGYPFTVVGVAPAGFDGDVVGERMALFVPLSMQPQIVRGRHWLNNPNVSWLALIGRLRPGINKEHAEADINLVFRQAMAGGYGASLSADDRSAIGNAHIAVVQGRGGLSELRAAYSAPLLMLMGIVGLVLLIACVNVANLLLARASVRNREIAVRLAVGAAPTRVLQQLLTESVLLALLGGAAGSLLATLGVRSLVSMIGEDAALPLSPDAKVLAFTLGVSLLTGILFGLVPAVRTLRVRVAPALKDSARTTNESSSRFSWSKSLIAGQVAISLLVLFAASLLVRSLQKLMMQDFGYSRDHLVIARLDPTSAGYNPEKMKLLAEQLATRLAATPGIRAVTYSLNGLFSHSESGDAILVPGFKSTKPHDRVAMEDYVGPDYFKVVGIPVLAGRGIQAQDRAGATRVAVVNEAMVKRFFAGQNPIGRQFLVDDPYWTDKQITIVGVSHDAKDHGSGIRDKVPPRFYLAYQQMPDPIQIMIVAQVEGVPSFAVANIKSQIKAVDPQLPITAADTLANLVNDSAANQIALAKLSAFFGGLALVLACVGLYGVMSYTVAGRTREIGVRMALGARRGVVVQLVLREALLLVAAGIVVGIPVALASGRLLRTFLFELSSADPLSLIAVVLMLGVVAAAATFIPARRASRIEPMVALRNE